MARAAALAVVAIAIPRPILSRSVVDVTPSAGVSFVHLGWGADESAEQHCAKVCAVVRAGGTVRYDNGTSSPLAAWGEDCRCDKGTPAQPVMKHSLFASDHSEEPQTEQGQQFGSSSAGDNDFEQQERRGGGDRREQHSGGRRQEARETDQSAGGSSSSSEGSSQFEGSRTAEVRQTPDLEERTEAEVTDRKSCKPVCTWACETPVCEQECRPKCEKAPECVTTCPPLDPASCTQECEYESDCRVECPPENEKLCPNRSGCLPCETKCYKQPKCKVKCPDIPCKTECAKPKCGWKCNKPKSCPTPKCRMICEDAPRSCDEEPPTLPPPQEGHTVVSRSRAKVAPEQRASRNAAKEKRKDREQEAPEESNIEPMVVPVTATTTAYGGLDQALGQTTVPPRS